MIATLALVLTGFGASVMPFSTGTVVSSFTLNVMLVVCPAPSLAVTTILFVPSARVTAFEKLPSVSTATDPRLVPFNVIVNVIGLEVASFVLPVTVSADLFVMSPAAGDEIVSVGGTVSIVNVE